MDKATAFFDPSIYEPSVFRNAEVAPPKATLGAKRKLTYITKGVQTVAAAALTATLAIPLIGIAGTTQSPIVVRPSFRRRRILGPRTLHREELSYERVKMSPRRVLVFRPIATSHRASPRRFREDNDPE